jgi:outer membrane protein OmpA-like peptidoglycan-associated protein
MARGYLQPETAVSRSRSRAQLSGLARRQAPVTASLDQLRHLPSAFGAADVRDLQRWTGNQVVARMLGDVPSPPTAARPDHRGQLVQRCGGRPCACAHEERDRTLVQGYAEPSAPAVDAVPESVATTLRSPGQPLDPAVRQEMAGRLDHDFSSVRVHTDAAASRSATDIFARAYAAGSHVVFGAGEYQPSTRSGRDLLAHELTHVLQQRQSSSAGPLVLGDPRSPAEAEAERHDPEPAAHPALVRRQPLAGSPRASPLTDRLLGSELLDGFALNGAALTDEHKARLAALAPTLVRLLREHPGGLVQVTGHTDASGGEALNEGLGQQRADAVRGFLLEAGVPATGLASVSAGESRLLVKAPGPEPRNRRAEVRFEPEPRGRSFPSGGLTLTPGTGPVTGGSPPLAPGELCKTNPNLSFCQPAAEPDLPRGAIFFPPSCTSTECSAVGNRFDDQPAELQRVLLASSFKDPKAWFAELDDERRMALSGIFNRLCSAGVWCHVTSIVKIEAGEAPVGDLFAVPGVTPSVHFTTPGDALLNALTATGKFCWATGTGASQHFGQSTFREISGSDSLHVSIGKPRGQFDAHIDRYSPAVEPGGFCSNAPTAAALRHIGREVVPEKVRKGFSFFGLFHVPGPAGFQFFPEEPSPALTEVPLPDTGAPRLSPGGSLVGITVRRPRPKPRTSGRAPADVPVLPVELVAPIDRAIAEQVTPEALLPSNVFVRLSEAQKAVDTAGPDEEEAARMRRDAAEREATTYPDPYEVARELAERMDRARRSRAGFVKIDLPQYDARDFGSRKAIAQQIRRMALIVRHHLPEGAADVRTVVIFFGSDNAATREEVKLP